MCRTVYPAMTWCTSGWLEPSSSPTYSAQLHCKRSTHRDSEHAYLMDGGLIGTDANALKPFAEACQLEPKQAGLGATNPSHRLIVVDTNMSADQIHRNGRAE